MKSLMLQLLPFAAQLHRVPMATISLPGKLVADFRHKAITFAIKPI